MDFRFSLNQINAFAHLLDGNILTFLEETFSSRHDFALNFRYLFDVLFYLSDPHIRKQWPQEEQLLQIIRKFMERNYYFQQNHERFDKYVGVSNVLDEVLRDPEMTELLDYLEQIHFTLKNARVKAIFLPGFGRRTVDKHLNSHNVTETISEICPLDSCLPLASPMELPGKEIWLKNSFRYFSTPMRHIDEWPAVLLWNDKESIFLPISNLDELTKIFRCVRYANSLASIKSLFPRKKRIAYFLHLSDLHLGASISARTRMRLLQLIKNEVSNLEMDTKTYPIITGDLMESPTEENKLLMDEFLFSLKNIGLENAIYVLGNHDVNTKGLRFSRRGAKEVIMSLEKKTHILKDMGVVLIRFNSNMDGKFARGKITEDQLKDVGNELDEIKDGTKYNCIALLHHHPIPIKKPKWYKREWYEKICFIWSEDTMKLVDSEPFLDWVKEKNINLILHGHKHIPQMQPFKGINIIACGSSTGKVKNVEKGKTYLSYNLIKYDLKRRKPASCVLCFEDLLGTGVKHLQARKL